MNTAELIDVLEQALVMSKGLTNARFRTEKKMSS